MYIYYKLYTSGKFQRICYLQCYLQCRSGWEFLSIGLPLGTILHPVLIPLIEHNRFSPNCFAFLTKQIILAGDVAAFFLSLSPTDIFCTVLVHPFQTGIECTHLLHVRSHPRAPPQEPPCDHIHVLFPYMLKGISTSDVAELHAHHKYSIFNAVIDENVKNKYHCDTFLRTNFVTLFDFLSKGQPLRQ